MSARETKNCEKLAMSTDAPLIKLPYEMSDLQPLCYIDEILYQNIKEGYVAFFLNNEDGKIWFKVQGAESSCMCLKSCFVCPCCSEYPASIVNATNGKEMIRIEKCAINCDNCWSVCPIRGLWYRKYAVQNVYSGNGDRFGRVVYARSIYSATFDVFDSNGKKIYRLKCPKFWTNLKKLKLQILSVQKSMVPGEIGHVVVGHLEIVYTHGLPYPLVHLKFPSMNLDNERQIEHRALLLALMMLYRRMCPDIYLNHLKE